MRLEWDEKAPDNGVMFLERVHDDGKIEYTMYLVMRANKTQYKVYYRLNHIRTFNSVKEAKIFCEVSYRVGACYALEVA